jgi:translation initiation factor IF-2
MQEPLPPVTKLITLAEGMTVKELADKLEVKVKDLMKKIIDRRMMMTINSTLDSETAQILARDFGAEVLIRSFEEELTEVETEASNDRRQARGTRRHGHGPRRSRQDDTARRHPRDEGRRTRSRRHRSTLAPTPSTSTDAASCSSTRRVEAFTLMRACGAKCRHRRVIVAADDGVMPQTVAIDHARQMC